jgi:capsular exopolysaccharide synthesis family protein
MMQDNRLLPLSADALDRPLRELAQPAPASAAPYSLPEPTHLREYLAVVLKRKWLILSIAVVVTSLVAIYMYRQPSIYEAQSTIQIEQKPSGVLTTQGTNNLIINSSDPNYWNTQLQKLKTQRLARQVILSLDLQHNPAFLGGNQSTGIIAGLRHLVSRARPTPTPQESQGGVPVLSESEVGTDQLTPEEEHALEPYEDVLRAGLNVDPVEKTNLVNITFQHADPDIAAKVVNALAEIFQNNDINEQTEGSKKAESLLAEQITELQTRIQQGQDDRINYLRSHKLPLGDKPGMDLNAQRLSTYSTQLQDAEAKRKDAEAAYASAMETRNSAGIWAIPQVQANPSVIKLREKIGELEQQKAALLVNYTEEWPAVKQINKQLKALHEQLDKQPDEIIAGLKATMDAARDKEAKTRAAYFTELGAADQHTIAALGLSDITQRLTTNQQLYQTYLQRQKELQVTQGERTSGNVSLVEEARVPHDPIGPKRAQSILVALVLSLGVGVGLAFLLDYLDDTLKSVEDVDRHLRLPTLALIPAPRETRRLLSRGSHEPEPATATALALIEDVRSPAAEAYRHLRTSLLLSSAGQPPKTVLVTSSQPSEGKTTTAVNIATMLAQTGADVLVLDCDLRRPRVHAHFSLPNARGVTNYLSGDAQVSDIVQTYEKLPNLKVITSGPVPPNAAELLGSEEMRKLLYLLAENFTHVIIDSPPAISFTDASILSTMVDGVMLVVHGGRSSRGVVRRAKQQLQDVGAHIFGIVLNNVKLEGTDYYYYSGYYSGYYSDDGDDAPEGAEAAGGGAG